MVQVCLDNSIEYIRDKDCTIDTPVRYGKKRNPIYGKGVKIKPRRPGRTDTDHMNKIYLPELFPLEEYDLIVVLFSGGKDSIASYLKLIELGVPKNKIEMWHHDIDGGHPYRHMDWRCTQNYVKAFAEAEGVPLRISWRKNGFFGELYRIGASEAIEWSEPDTGEVIQCKLSPKYLKCIDLKRQATEKIEEQLRQYGYRMKFPAKTGDLNSRWCSAYLKVMVADSVMINLSRLGELEFLGGKSQRFPVKGNILDGKTKQDMKILIVSGERRGESPGRSRYNEIEIHRTNATVRAHRLVHQWRPVIDWSEKDVWEIMKRHRITSHPCYRAGWNRCSCAMCIFSTPSLFAGIKELYPAEFELLKQDEKKLGFTLDNRCDLETFVRRAESCVYNGDEKAIHSLVTGEFDRNQVYVSGLWYYPAGAFRGSSGGPC